MRFTKSWLGPGILGCDGGRQRLLSVLQACLRLFPCPAADHRVNVGFQEFDDGRQRVVVGHAIDVERTSDKVQVAVCQIELISGRHFRTLDMVDVSEFAFFRLADFPLFNAGRFGDMPLDE